MDEAVGKTAIESGCIEYINAETEKATTLPTYSDFLINARWHGQGLFCQGGQDVQGLESPLRLVTNLKDFSKLCINPFL